VATITDLLSSNQPSDSTLPIDRVPWYGRIVAPQPVSTTDPIYVVIPDLDPTWVIGPAKWSSVLLADAVVGATCLIVFDNQHTPWVVSIG
jgi:hypothetical protein